MKPTTPAQKSITRYKFTTREKIIIYLIAFGLFAIGWSSAKSAIKSFQSKDWPVYLGQVAEKNYEIKTDIGDNGGKYKDWELKYTYYLLDEWEHHDDNFVMGFDSSYMDVEHLPNQGAMVEVHYHPQSGATCINTSVNWSNIALSLVSLYVASLLLVGRLIPAKLKLILGLFVFGSIPFWLIASGFGWLTDKTAPYYRPNIYEICDQHARKGSAEYQCRLGEIFDEGKLVAKDKDEALEWYKKAADQGHRRATINASKLLIDGNMTDSGVSSVIINAYNKEAGDPLNKFFIGKQQKELHDIAVQLLMRQKEYKKALKLHIECYESKKDPRTGNPILSTTTTEIFEYWLLLGEIYNYMGDREAALKGWNEALVVGGKISLQKETSVLKKKILLLQLDDNSTQTNESK